MGHFYLMDITYFFYFWGYNYIIYPSFSSLQTFPYPPLAFSQMHGLVFH